MTGCTIQKQHFSFLEELKFLQGKLRDRTIHEVVLYTSIYSIFQKYIFHTKELLLTQFLSYKCLNWTLYAVFRMLCLINYVLYQLNGILELCIKDSVRRCCWRRPEKILAETVTSSPATFNLGKLYRNFTTIVQNKNQVNGHLAIFIFYNYPTRREWSSFYFFIVIIDRILFFPNSHVGKVY